MNPTFQNLNINQYVRVKLTDQGRALHRQNHDEFVAQLPKSTSLRYTPPTEDAEGWSEWQLWHLMQEFGHHMSMGKLPPFETTIQVPVK